MESSFFEYREEDVASDSDTDVIEESLIDEIMPKTPKRSNHTVVPDSEESLVYDGSEDEKDSPQAVKSVARKSITEAHVIASSDDDASRQVSRQSQNMTCNDDATSSDEEQISPELVPKRRPPTRPKSLNSSTESPVIRRMKKRMVLLDSDTDNSIIIEKNKNTKMKCMKDTPLKIDTGKSPKGNDSEEETDASQSDEDMDDDTSDEDDTENGSDDGEETAGPDNGFGDEQCKVDNGPDGDDENEDGDVEDDDDGPDEDQLVMSRATRMSIMGIIPKQNESDESDFIESDDSVKNSIAGSTESLTDVPAVDLSSGEPLEASTDSITDLPEVNVTRRTPLKPQTKLSETRLNENTGELEENNDNSVLTCSPIQSPLRNVTNEFNNSAPNSPIIGAKFTPKSTGKQALKDKVLNNLILSDNKKETKYYDGEVTVVEDGFSKPNRVFSKSSKSNSYYDGEVTVVEDCKDKPVRISTGGAGKEDLKGYEDDEVAVIDTPAEVIMLSSDEEDEMNPPKKSPNAKTSPKPMDTLQIKRSPSTKAQNPKTSPKQNVDFILINPPKLEMKTSPKPKPEPKKSSTIRQYLPPPSYPNQVVYVQKHIRDNELNKLEGMKQDLHNIRNLLDNMDVSTLPDGGSKLISRLSELEEAVRRQGDRVGNMVVEPDRPTPADVARDGFDQGLSWDELQKASNAVQPRMFGKQAMSTHLAERNLILERLRDLHSALDSRPPEEKQAQPPAALKTALMPHQLHALAWLRWRETQSPPGGILADDMGLGKTITMISLIASDREIRDDEESDDDDDEYDRPKGRLTKGGTLVVCPASLMTQWEGEVKKHCLPHRLSTCLHHGAARATQPQRLAHVDIVLTTYNILQRDSEKNGVLSRISWRRAILDEAHIVRNHKSATSRAVCALRARRRWALTGTPLHNKDLDLFALLKFLRCTPFDDLTMWKKWIDNKTQGGQERLSTIMRCIMLRRTKVQLQAKGQLKDLPARTAHQEHVTLTKEEMNVYQKVISASSCCIMVQLQAKGQLKDLPARTAHQEHVTLTKEEMNVYQKVISASSCCIMVQLQAKGQLKDLPARTAHQEHVTLTKEEMNVYQKVLVFSKTLFASFLHQRAEKNSDGAFVPRQKDSAYYEMHKKMIALQGAKPVKAHEILVLLLRLRQVCCHCGLIAAMLDEDDTGGLAEDEGGKDLLAELNKLTLEESTNKDETKKAEPEPEQEGTTAAEAIRSVLSPNNPVFELSNRSSKIRAVMDCLKKNVLANKGEKAVVVSQWTSVLSLVEEELKQEKVRSVTLSGSVPVPARAALVHALNDPKSDVRVMLLSLCAGGVGLNLCGASHLLLLDPHWNPQLEEQAQDRIYRVGQTRPVHVYKFMCVDTVEQSIRKLQEAKLEMAANVLTGARHNTASKLSIEDLKVLFNMGQQ